MFGNHQGGVPQKHDGEMLEAGDHRPEQVQALLQADLEMSPLVSVVPPMPVAMGGPSIPRTMVENSSTQLLAPKRTDINSARAVDYSSAGDFHQMNPPPVQQPMITNSSDNTMVPQINMGVALNMEMPDPTPATIMQQPIKLEGAPQSGLDILSATPAVPTQQAIPIPAPAPPVQPVTSAAAAAVKEETIDIGDSKKKNRKKAPKPLRRILYARKERDTAKRLLRGKSDLLDALPQEECDFLAEKCWIFTQEQLTAVIDPSSIRDMEHIDEIREKAKVAREELVTELASRYYTEAHGATEDVKVNEVAIPASSEGSLSTPSGVGGGAFGTEGVTVPSSAQPFPIPTGRNPFNMPTNDATPNVGQSIGLEPAKVGGVSEAIGTSNVPFGDEQKARAEETLKEWKKLIVEKSKISELEEQFPLNGPLSNLIPEGTRNFLLTAKIKSAYGFLSLRRTETGAICDMLRVWREKCGLVPLNHLALAKHLLGITARIELALSSPVPADRKTRFWMNDAIVVMTGAARDFLVDYLGLLTAKQFVATRTKDLSARLVEWREKKGLVPLKGSGKVAMVSGWKACAREEIEAQNDPGKYFPDVDLIALSSADIPVTEDDSTLVVASRAFDPTANAGAALRQSSPKKLKVEKVFRIHNVEYAPHYEEFLPYVLGDEAAQVLVGLGITTSSELESARSVTPGKLKNDLVAAGKASSEEEADKLITAWTSKISEKIAELEKEDMAKSEAKAARARARFRHSNLNDPFDILSASTKAFLVSIGITTGEQFLSTRTTDIASEFVKWRVQEGKPELKGLGSIASVSGWKATCRKAASEMGLPEIAALEPEGKSAHKWEGGQKAKPVGKSSPLLAQPKPVLPLHDKTKATEEKILSGNMRSELAVQKTEGKRDQLCPPLYGVVPCIIISLLLSLSLFQDQMVSITLSFLFDSVTREARPKCF